MAIWKIQSKPADGGVVVVDSPCDVYKDGYTQSLGMPLNVAFESIILRARLDDVIQEDHSHAAVGGIAEYTVRQYVQATMQRMAVNFLKYNQQFPN